MAATDGRTITINIRAITGELTSGMQKARSETKAWAADTQGSIAAVEASTERIARLWRSAFEAFIGLAAINMLKKLALGAAEAGDELAVAARIAQNFGHAFDVDAMEKWLEAFARSAAGGGYAIDEMRKSVQSFAALGLDTAQIQRAMADTANLAAARQMDFGEATTIVTRALTGHVELLSRYGIISREAAKHIHTVEEAMKAIEKASAGAAAERSNSLIGTFGRLSTAAELLGNTIGKSLEPFFESAANLLTKLANALDKIPKPILDAVAGFAAMAIGLGATALLLPAIAKGFAILGEGLKLALSFVVPLAKSLDMLAFAFQAAAAGEAAMAAEAVLAALGPALIAAGVAALAIAIIEIIRHLADFKVAWSALVSVLVDKWQAFVADFERLTAPLAGIFRAVVETVSAIWKVFVSFLSDAWGAFVGDFQDKMHKAIDQLGALVSALQPVMSAWDRFTQYLSDRFGDFVSKLGLQVDEVKGILAGMVTGGAIAGPLGALLGAIGGAGGGDKNKQGTAGSPHAAFGKLADDIKADWKSFTSSLGSLFKSSLGATPKIPGEGFPGIVPGKTGGRDGSGAAAADALKNAEEAVKEALASFANRVADARHLVEKSTSAVDEYKATLPGGKPQNDEQSAQLQKLITNELNAQRALHDRLQEQQIAELAAAKGFESYAAKISVHLKNHDQLVRQAKDGALEHVRAAQQLAEEYLRIGVTIAQIKANIRDTAAEGIRNAAHLQIDANDQALTRRDLARASDQQAIDQAMAMAQAGGNAGISWATPAGSESVKNARQQVEKEVHSGGDKTSNVSQDRLKIALDELALATAKDKEATDKNNASILEEVAARTKLPDDIKAATDAQNLYLQSVLDVTKANDTLLVSQQKLQLDLQQKWDQLMNGLIEKVGAPGLGFNSTTQSVSFDPMAMLFSAFEQTRSFGDIMTTVTQIMQTFSQAMDALKPIVDALLDVIRAVVNVFIFMYNAVARILELFGMQIQQLQYLNAAIGQLVPLIEIWHEIPTLNELAAGKLNSPLSTTPTGLQNVGGPGQGQNALMKVVEVLTGILAAVILEHVIAGASLQAAFQQTMHLLGINIGVNKIPAVDTALSAQEKTTALGISAKSQGLEQIIGAKAAGLTLTTNSLLVTANTTLTGILAALQTKNIISMLTSGFTAGIPGGGSSIPGLPPGGIGGGGGVFGNSMLGGSGGPLAAMTAGLQNLGAGFANLSRMLTDHVAALRSATNAVRALTDAATGASRVLSNLSIPALSTALSVDTSRRSAVSGYGIDRAPI